MKHLKLYESFQELSRGSEFEKNIKDITLNLKDRDYDIDIENANETDEWVDWDWAINISDGSFISSSSANLWNNEDECIQFLNDIDELLEYIGSEKWKFLINIYTFSKHGKRPRRKKTIDFLETIDKNEMLNLKNPKLFRIELYL